MPDDTAKLSELKLAIPLLSTVASSPVIVTSPVSVSTSIPSPATILVTLAAVLPTGKTPVTSC